jgi:hypothetical protein
MTNKLPQWIIDILDKTGWSAHETLVEQMRVNPDAIEALYGGD